MSQLHIALTLIRYGIELAGLLWGIAFPHVPYPQMGLSVHLLSILNSTFSLPFFPPPTSFLHTCPESILCF